MSLTVLSVAVNALFTLSRLTFYGHLLSESRHHSDLTLQNFGCSQCHSSRRVTNPWNSLHVARLKAVLQQIDLSKFLAYCID